MWYSSIFRGTESEDVKLNRRAVHVTAKTISRETIQKWRFVSFSNSRIF